MQTCSEKLHRCASLVPGDMQHVMAEETQVRQILQVTKWKRNVKDVDCCQLCQCDLFSCKHPCDSLYCFLNFSMLFVVK